MDFSFPPKKIGKYRIQRELGQGASSVVYLGFDPFTRRSVAIKTTRPGTLHDPVAGGRFRKLFLKEASLAGQLSHPHIVKLYDAVIEDDLGYLVMEYVPGGTLKQYCHMVNLLPAEKVVEIVFKCSQALAFANRQGIIHRDIKPANIMLHGDLDIKIADFGAARLSRGDQTQAIGQMGSPAYMSPEQILENEQTFHTDMYSLGVVMYELLTGRQPFNADNDMALAFKILHEEAPPVRVLRPECPQRLEEIVARTLRKDPAERYPNWEAFAADLMEVYRHLHLPATPLGDTDKFNLLREMTFFDNFSEVELWEVLRLGSWRKFSSGTLLQKEGNIGNAVFLLASGSARVTKRGKDLGILGKGDCFGEMSYIDQTLARPFTITAAEEVLLIKIKSSSLQQASDNCQLAFNRAFLKILVRRLADAEDKLASLLLDITI